MTFRRLLLFGLVSSTTLCQLSSAQSGETGLNYSFIIYNPAKGVAGERALNGGGGSVGFNLGEYLTLKGEIEGYTTTVLTFHLPQTAYSPAGTFQSQGNMVTFLFGPQINIPLAGKRVFGETLFGLANTGAYTDLFRVAGVKGLSGSNSGLAMAIGGGFDISISRHVGLRPVQLDYFLTRYEWKPLGINNQSNFRYQAGVVFFWNKS